jgi:hypothetical protein
MVGESNERWKNEWALLYQFGIHLSKKVEDLLEYMVTRKKKKKKN